MRVLAAQGERREEKLLSAEFCPGPAHKLGGGGMTSRAPAQLEVMGPPRVTASAQADLQSEGGGRNPEQLAVQITASVSTLCTGCEDAGLSLHQSTTQESLKVKPGSPETVTNTFRHSMI